MQTQFEQLGKEVGITVVASESCEVEDTDLSSQCARLLAAKPQAILMSIDIQRLWLLCKTN
ncbi:MAG: hypothetical protein ACOX7R_07405 [Acetivibrionales bacterium]